MRHSPDITLFSSLQQVMGSNLEVLQDKTQTIPGSVQYNIQRYRKAPDWFMEDKGLLVYHYSKSQPSKRYLELNFCVSGNVYCRQKNIECDKCQLAASPTCMERVDSVDVISFRFSPAQLSQFVKPRNDGTKLDSILKFTHKETFSVTQVLCPKISTTLESILNNKYSDTLENIFINAQTQMLLLYSLDCMINEQPHTTISCKFLANEADREKIAKAREILIQHIGEPITIKELSRKVAINECYLKKGFKEMYGTTVFDFYQSQRMEHAKYLLYEKGCTVTEVSMLLGYSSISHFSTAFKRHTGAKPCDLLR
jgi:AraC-like DNA-binding protein